ncbi:MAG: histidinol dehydrogenase [Clostridiales bacterium]|nr:histidinol dehydrogenase [Clostridiales bacterium]
MITITTDKKLALSIIEGRGQLDNEQVISKVTKMMTDIRSNKDEAIKRYTELFDGIIIDKLMVSEEEIKFAYKMIDGKFLKIIRQAIKNITKYHEKLTLNSWLWEKEPGITLGQKITPLDTVGIYVPGGVAPLISSVLMNAIPAKVAGVNKVIMCTPPEIDNERIVAAKECGVDQIFKIGGAQAIFAMAFGTESVPKVDKITGPGNIFVANAKRLVYGYCDIDMIAGPSEIMIVADDSAKVAYIAADLLSQAEHDKLAGVILGVTSMEKAKKVEIELEKQVKTLSRKETILCSLNDYGVIYVDNDMDNLISLVNEIAPEHLELLVNNPDELIDKVKNAGAIFKGMYSPEPLGDYFAGPNHTLPTGGTARFYSPLGTYDFQKRTSVIEYSEKQLKKVAKSIEAFAKKEGLDAHKRAISIRFEE